MKDRSEEKENSLQDLINIAHGNDAGNELLWCCILCLWLYFRGNEGDGKDDEVVTERCTMKLLK